MAAEWETKLSLVDAEKESLRAVVPAPVVKLLGLESGGSVRWTVDVSPAGVTVRVERGSSKRSRSR